MATIITPEELDKFIEGSPHPISKEQAINLLENRGAIVQKEAKKQEKKDDLVQNFIEKEKESEEGGGFLSGVKSAIDSVVDFSDSAFAEIPKQAGNIVAGVENLADFAGTALPGRPSIKGMQKKLFGGTLGEAAQAGGEFLTEDAIDSKRIKRAVAEGEIDFKKGPTFEQYQDIINREPGTAETFGRGTTKVGAAIAPYFVTGGMSSAVNLVGASFGATAIRGAQAGEEKINPLTLARNAVIDVTFNKLLQGAAGLFRKGAGVSDEVYNFSKQNPEMVKDALKGKLSILSLVDETDDVMRAADAGKRTLGATKGAIVTGSKETIKRVDLIDDVGKALKQWKVKISPDKTLDFSKSLLRHNNSAAKQIGAYWDDLLSHPNKLSVEMVDDLKQVIKFSEKSDVPGAVKNQIQGIFRTHVATKAPQVAVANKEYKSAINLLKDFKNLQPQTNAQGTMTFLKGLFKPSRLADRRGFKSVLELAGKPEFMTKLEAIHAAEVFRPYVTQIGPTGVRRIVANMIGTALGGGAIVSPGSTLVTAPATIAGGVATSPRLHGAIATGAIPSSIRAGAQVTREGTRYSIKEILNRYLAKTKEETAKSQP